MCCRQKAKNGYGMYLFFAIPNELSIYSAVLTANTINVGLVANTSFGA